ncbi:MAG: glycerophosphodiester phosphodiesterase [Rhodospirillaceae bacterium]|nr:glycerophosphodiester phosphodiesterase [Rhodospirillaceae bacterium]
MIRTLLILGFVCIAASAFAADKPLVIAHRGASGYLPEHTLEAYSRAVALGADFIEPDLVSTKDGVLIARHENELSDTTDVAEKFPTRKTKKVIDGRETEGWFSEDFTLAEIKTLRAKQRLAFRNQADNGKFPIPTLAEVIALAKTEGAKRGRVVGLYPETKHPTYFQGIGLALEPPLVRELKAAGLDRADAAVFIQSFEVANLKQLKSMTAAPLVQLLGGGDERPYDQEALGSTLTYAAMATPQGLREIAVYARGVGPFKGLIIPMDREGNTSAPTTFVADAHAAGLKVHPYTFRNEAQYLAKPYGGDPIREYCAFYILGVDGLFSDFPDTALKARDESCPMTAR